MVKIVADTTSSVPLSILGELGIPCIPQMIVFGETTYRDDTEMDTAMFLSKLRSSPALPKTAAPPPSLYTPIYKESIDRGEDILVVAPSAELSGTVRSALVAANDFPEGHIQVVDTRTIAGGLASLVLTATEWSREAPDLAALAGRVSEMASRERVYFLVDTLEYLFKGGRIGGAQALLGGLLQVKPILTLKNGRAEAVESLRTKKRALARLIELVKMDCPRTAEAHLTVSHSDNEAEARWIADQLCVELGIRDIPIYQLPPAIVVHAGPGTLSVSFFVEK